MYTQGILVEKLMLQDGKPGGEERIFLGNGDPLGKLPNSARSSKGAKLNFQHRHDHFFWTIIILIKGDFNDLHDLRRQPSRSSLMSTFSQGVKDKFAVGFLFLFLVKTIFFSFFGQHFTLFVDFWPFPECAAGKLFQEPRTEQTPSLGLQLIKTTSSPPTMLYPHHPYKYNQCHDDTIILLIYKVCIMAAICVGMVVTTHVFYVQHKGKVSVSNSK